MKSLQLNKLILDKSSLKISYTLNLNNFYGEPLLLKRIEDMTVLIDVRTLEEFEQGHLQGAICIGYKEILSYIQSVALNKETSILLYCHSGQRSELAKHILLSAGYKNVENLGGYNALKHTVYC